MKNSWFFAMILLGSVQSTPSFADLTGAEKIEAGIYGAIGAAYDLQNIIDDDIHGYFDRLNEAITLLNKGNSENIVLAMQQLRSLELDTYRHLVDVIQVTKCALIDTKEQVFEELKVTLPWYARGDKRLVDLPYPITSETGLFGLSSTLKTLEVDLNSGLMPNQEFELIETALVASAKSAGENDPAKWIPAIYVNLTRLAYGMMCVYEDTVDKVWYARKASIYNAKAAAWRNNVIVE